MSTQNTYKHISDESRFKTFDPSGTEWPDNVTDVQSALSLISASARTDVGLPIADKTTKGIVKLSTDDDAFKGENDTDAVTPKQMDYKMRHPHASFDVYGTTKYASNDLAIGLSDTETTITPVTLGYVFDNRNATESVYGTMRVATQLQANAGEDDSVVITAKKLRGAVAAMVPGYDDATESVTGIVRLATVAQIREGVVKNGYAISPASFNALGGTEQYMGVYKVATQVDMNSGTNDSVVVTAKKFVSTKGSSSRYGVVKLTTDLNNAEDGYALSPKAPIVSKSFTINGKKMDGNSLTISAGDVNAWTKQESDSRYMRIDAAPKQDIFLDMWSINQNYYRKYWKKYETIGTTTIPFGSYKKMQFNLNITNSSDLRPLQMKIYKNNVEIHYYEYFAKYMNYAPITPRILIHGDFRTGDVIRADINCNSGNNMVINITTCELLFSQ